MRESSATNQETIFEAIRQGFQEPNYGTVGVFIICLMLTLVAVIAAFFIHRRREELREALNDPTILLWELGGAHELSVPEKELLVRLAREIGLDRPDRLFVRHDLFDKAAKSSPLIDVRENGELDRLRTKLFTWEPSPPQAPVLCSSE